MTEGATALDPQRPEVERRAALQTLKDRVDPQLLTLFPALLAAGDPLAAHALDGLERLAFADPAAVAPIAEALHAAVARASEAITLRWVRLLGTLGTPWALDALRTQASDGPHPTAARAELARHGEAHTGAEPTETAELRRVAATAQALSALDARQPVAAKQALMLLDVGGFALLIKLLQAGLLTSEAQTALAGFAPPAQLTQSQRALARRLAEALARR